MAGMINGGGNGRGRGRYRPLADINVTPLVDVMLVLLIIFMVTAPLMSTAVNVDLPKAATNPISQDSEPLTVSVDATGQVFLQDQKVDLSELVAKLRAIAQDNQDRRIFVRGDKANAYGRIIEVMGTLVQGGFTKAALVSEPPAGVEIPAAPAPATPTQGAPAPATPAGGAPAATAPVAPVAPPAAPAAPAPQRPPG
jgi:biopolymer transport protein TolR